MENWEYEELIEAVLETYYDYVEAGHPYIKSAGMAVGELWEYIDEFRKVENLICTAIMLKKVMEEHHVIAFAIFVTFKEVQKNIDKKMLQKELTLVEYSEFKRVLKYIENNIDKLEYNYSYTSPQVLKEHDIEL